MGLYALLAPPFFFFKSLEGDFAASWTKEKLQYSLAAARAGHVAVRELAYTMAIVTFNMVVRG